MQQEALHIRSDLSAILCGTGAGPAGSAKTAEGGTPPMKNR